MSLIWGLPFLGVMLSLALGPALAPRLWHKRLGLGCLIWSLALLVPYAAVMGTAALKSLLESALIGDYLPFVSLIMALSVAGGGILLRGGPFGRPLGNTLLLAAGCVLAGLIGTTGASMVLIHPLLRANAHRTRKFHLVLFFVVLVANGGGALSPLGPPLFLGFLAGVPLFWPLLHLGLPLLFLAACLLIIFYLLDRTLAASEPPPAPGRLHVRGLRNIALVGCAVASIALPRLWGVADCLAVTAVSMFFTPSSVRASNMWGAAPIIEVGKLFAALFITMQPVIAMLMLGTAGPLAPLLALAHGPAEYFWISGWLSAFLDNAPTYQLLFNMAGGHAAWLAGAGSKILGAISAGSVFFGALTYIGNAPNMMIQSIAAHRGVRMPGFFGYFLWAALLLVPLLVLMQLIFF
jgi:Na+/H+ antiporter NhaD/arsenite permease-like protein